jgi:hypothetical protein
LNRQIRRSALIFENKAAWNHMNYSNVGTTHLSLPDEPGLEFPDWSGMQPHQSGLSPAGAFLWNEAMLSLFPGPARKMREPDSARCAVEFKS